MILSREQINRYLRHIIIPEVSGKGQKKIIEAKIFILAEDNVSGASLLYYLAASGVGSIACCFINSEGYEDIFENVRDINNECTIKIIDINVLKNENAIPEQGNFTLGIFLLKKNKIWEAMANYPVFEKINKDIPVILSFYSGWKGFIQFFGKSKCISELYSKLIDNIDENKNEYEKKASVFSSGFLGAITAIEALKFYLEIGLTREKPLYFDLLSMKFKGDNSQNIDDFFSYGGIELSKKGEYKTSKEPVDCRVLIVGTGGLGSPAALSLAGAGVGTIGLVDFDSVEISNLNRQILHSISRIGIPKVESAEKFINNAFSNINIIKYDMVLDKNNVMEIIKKYDVIIDGVDNFPARYLLNDACYFAEKPMIEAGALKFNGLNMTILPGESTCYRCLFPDIPEKGSYQSCSEVGVLGPVPGVMGFIQGAEAYKLLTGWGELLTNKIMYFDALSLDFDIISVDRISKCKLCGESPSITELAEYDFSC